MVYLEEFNRYVAEDGKVFSDVRGSLKELKQHLKPGKHGGYWMVSVDRNKFSRGDYPVHRLLAIAFIPNPNNYKEIDHIDRNRANNALSNLRWVSRHENCMNTGRGQKLRALGIKAGTPEYYVWWTENNRDHLKEYNANRYQANKEEHNKYSRDYYATHREQCRAQQKAYRARIKEGAV